MKSRSTAILAVPVFSVHEASFYRRLHGARLQSTVNANVVLATRKTRKSHSANHVPRECRLLVRAVSAASYLDSRPAYGSEPHLSINYALTVAASRSVRPYLINRIVG